MYPRLYRFLFRFGRFAALTLVLVLVGSFCSLVLPGVGAAATLYVSTTGNDANNCLSTAKACRTIQNAVNVASTGSTILVSPGTYTEFVSIATKSLTLKGLLGEGITTIKAPSAGAQVVLVSGVGHSVSISGFTIDGSESTDAIVVETGAALTISGSNIIEFESVGIIALFVATPVASLTCNANMIDGEGEAGEGVVADHVSGSVKCTSNTITGIIGTGVSVGNVVGTVTASSNKITTTGANGVFTDTTGPVTANLNRVTGSTGDGIFVHAASGAATALNNVISVFSGTGIFTDGTGPVTATGNTITGSIGEGIFVHAASGATTVSSNVISATSGIGVFTDGTGPVTANLNRVTGSIGEGIFVHAASGAVTVSSNTISAAGPEGIFTDTTGAVTANGNTITGTTSDGIRVHAALGAFTVSNNKISVAFSYGIFTDTTGAITANGNTITGSTSTAMDLRFATALGGGAVTVTNNKISVASNDGISTEFSLSVTISGNSVIDSVTGTYIPFDWDVGIFDVTGNVLVQGNSLNGGGVQSDGVHFGSTITGTINVHKNFIFGHTAQGVDNTISGKLVDARNNWWGSASGPDDDVHPPTDACGISTTNPAGTGDSVTTCVLYSPWLTSNPSAGLPQPA